MRFSIRLMLAVTLLCALAIHTYARWRNLDVIRAEIIDYSLRIEHQGFQGRHAATMVKICETAIEDTELPTPSYRSAEENFHRLYPEEHFGRE